MSRRLLSYWAAVTLCACFVSHAAPAYAEVSLEYRVKAAFLFNFAKFVDWPESAFEAPDSPIRLCIAGRDPFGESIDATVAERRVGTRGFAVSRVASLDQVGSCHLLYVNPGHRAAEQELRGAVGTKPVLTVGELVGDHPGARVINFLIVDGKVRFEIDRAAAKRAGLTVSSKLLGVAVAVHDGEGR